jgi:hypothetical protein
VGWRGKKATKAGVGFIKMEDFGWIACLVGFIHPRNLS